VIVREKQDDTALLITQEDHAELSAQLAAHWGNEKFSKLEPYESMVFATLHHDSGYREWEGVPPINLLERRPYGHREDPPSFEETELHGYVANVDWLKGHDPYAALIVSMHRTGLWQNRYDVLGPAKRKSQRSQETWAVSEKLESRQVNEKKLLSNGNPGFERQLWFNYKALQVYDVLSLYFCVNGYEGEGLKEDRIGPIPVSYNTDEEIILRIVPINEGAVQITPYPFDVSPLKIALRTRTLRKRDFRSEQECREAYFKAPRALLSFKITR
jgi:Protein of unknown function (DUF3891)